MNKFFRGIVYLLPVIFFFSHCRDKKNAANILHYNKTSFDAYIQKGNAAYAKKEGMLSVAESQEYFDTAEHIAIYLDDSVLIAKSVFAKARIYDAWNKEPEKTIEYFGQAADLYSRIEPEESTYFYIKLLLAHAYEKNKDSANCIRIIKELHHEFSEKNSLSIPEINLASDMALVCTQIRNYKMAQEILHNLTVDSLIINDTASLNFRDHYFLTRGRLEVFYEKKPPYPYLDSLEQIYQNASNNFDRMFYSDELQLLYAGIGNTDRAYFYMEANQTAYRTVHNQKDIDTIRRRMLRMEMESLTRESELIRKSKQVWILTIITLSLLAMGGVIAGFIYRKGRNKYFHISKDLEISNQKTTLLYKELHHRIKNNLHTIFSLLQMQERKTSDPATISNLRTARLRIESIAVMHEELLQHDLQLDFKSFLQRLTKVVTDCFSLDQHIITHLNIEEVSVPPLHSFPLALIINEWISNSIKHAVVENNSLEIFVDITDAGNRIRISYRDNGTKLKEDKNEHGLGKQIIHLLSQQIHGTLETHPDNPFHYILNIAKHDTP